MRLSCHIVQQKARPLAGAFDQDDESVRRMQQADADEFHLLDEGELD